MLFFELHKIMVNKVALVDFRGGQSPQSLPLEPPLIHIDVKHVPAKYLLRDGRAASRTQCVSLVLYYQSRSGISSIAKCQICTFFK